MVSLSRSYVNCTVNLLGDSVTGKALDGVILLREGRIAGG